MSFSGKITWLTLFLSLSLAVPAQVPRVSIGDAEIRSVAGSLEIGEAMILENVDLGLDDSGSFIELERFRVFSRTAVIRVHGENGVQQLPPPKNVYLRGAIQGVPGSRVILSVLQDGTMRGIANSLGRYWIFGGGEKAGGPPVGLMVRELEPEELDQRPGGFSCGTDNLPVIAPSLEKSPTQPNKRPGKRSGFAGTPSYNAKVAFDSDFEYYNLFGNTTDATDYAGDLVAYATTVYEAEVDTSLSLEHLDLWTTAADPWAEPSTGCGLMEFGRYWNDNNGGVTRTLAHFLSGKTNGGGIAWVGVLCSGPFNFNISSFGCGTLTPNTDNYGGAYGYSGDLDGNFDLGNPTPVWDIVVVSHEIGHNFNSPHTMCYAGLEGNPNHVDTCADQCNNASCWCGANTLPANCPGGGMGCGTIMSYCHFLGGGLSNIGLTFGQGHPYGIAPGRVPTRMNNHVVSAAGANPGCLEQIEIPYEVLLETWPFGVTVIDLLNSLFF